MGNTLFYALSGLMLIFSLMAITRRNPIDSAICLVFVFLFMAGLFGLLHAYFLATIQVLVYAGAIMVLFLFVIMLINVTEKERRKIRWFSVGCSILVALSLATEFIMLFFKYYFSEKAIIEVNLIGLTENIGKLLFSKYLLPFEVTSLLLLTAMIGVIILNKKDSDT